MEKTQNNKAWLFVLPVLVLVAFSAVIPLMTVVNYSVQDTFGNNVFFWAGLEWYIQVLESERFHQALLRQFLSPVRSWRFRFLSVSPLRSPCRARGGACRSVSS